MKKQSKKQFPHELWMKFDRLVNPHQPHDVSCMIIGITQYYDNQYVIVTRSLDLRHDIKVVLVKLDIYGEPFFQQDFGHWTF